MTTHFTFFESYYSSVKDLDNNLKAEFFDVLFQYALYDIEPISSINAVVKALFTLVKPNLDGSKQRREAGKQGGSKSKANSKQTESKQEARQKQVPSDKEKEEDKERGVKRFIPPTLLEVIAYQQDKCKNVDANFFYEYFSESGWVDSKGNKVKSWKQKMMSWNKRESATTRH
jgi:hypothetical protein